jgi:predicted enzyme related to lactoylglutathione lyase
VHKAFVSHVEWCSPDIEKSAAFLQAMFDWRFKPFGNNYLLCVPEQGPAVGLLRSRRATQGDNCLVFVTVANLDNHLHRATSLGGAVHVAKTAIPQYGWYAQIRGEDGIIVGLFEDWK